MIVETVWKQCNMIVETVWRQCVQRGVDMFVHTWTNKDTRACMHAHTHRHVSDMDQREARLLPLNRSVVVSDKPAVWVSQELCITQHILTAHSARCQATLRSPYPPPTMERPQPQRRHPKQGQATRTQLPLRPQTQPWFLHPVEQDFLGQSQLEFGLEFFLTI